MKKVSVVGVSGSGKSTFAARLAASLDAPFVELDSMFHQAGWQQLATAEFQARVSEVLAGDRWVVDGNYSAVRPLVWEQADTVVWLDMPRSLIMRRVTTRTLRRLVTREELWNGNREPLTSPFRIDPEKSIIRWAWVTYPQVEERYSRAMADPANGHLRFVRLRRPAEVEAFLA